MIGSIGAALLIGSRRGSVLVALLVLPLYIPVLIFGVSAVDGVLLGLGEPRRRFSSSLPCCLPHAALTPFASAAALRLALE